jgi:hypothetical protein
VWRAFAVVGPFSGFKTGGPKKPSLFHGGRGILLFHLSTYLETKRKSMSEYLNSLNYIDMNPLIKQEELNYFWNTDGVDTAAFFNTSVPSGNGFGTSGKIDGRTLSKCTASLDNGHAELAYTALSPPPTPATTSMQSFPSTTSNDERSLLSPSPSDDSSCSDSTPSSPSYTPESSPQRQFRFAGSNIGTSSSQRKKGSTINCSGELIKQLLPMSTKLFNQEIKRLALSEKEILNLKAARRRIKNARAAQKRRSKLSHDLDFLRKTVDQLNNDNQKLLHQLAIQEEIIAKLRKKM